MTNNVWTQCKFSAINNNSVTVRMIKYLKLNHGAVNTNRGAVNRILMLFSLLLYIFKCFIIKSERKQVPSPMENDSRFKSKDKHLCP